MCIQLIQQQEWQVLYDNDQLHAQQLAGAAFQYFQESPLTFRPTAPLARGLTGDYQPGVCRCCINIRLGRSA